MIFLLKNVYLISAFQTISVVFDGELVESEIFVTDNEAIFDRIKSMFSPVSLF